MVTTRSSLVLARRRMIPIHGSCHSMNVGSIATSPTTGLPTYRSDRAHRPGLNIHLRRRTIVRQVQGEHVGLPRDAQGVGHNQLATIILLLAVVIFRVRHQQRVLHRPLSSTVLAVVDLYGLVSRYNMCPSNPDTYLFHQHGQFCDLVHLDLQTTRSSAFASLSPAISSVCLSIVCA